VQQTGSLFDHLIGTGEQCRWHFEGKQTRRCEVDDELEPSGWPAADPYYF